MNILVCCIALFLTSLLLQIFWWRIRLPRSQTRALYALFTGILAVFIAANLLGIFRDWPWFHLSIVESIYMAVAYFSLLMTYGIFYGMVEADSPSSMMSLALEAAGKRGLRKEAFSRFITDEGFIWNRVRFLEIGGHVRFENQRYFITPAGRKYMRLFLLPRILIGRRESGG